MSMLRDALLLYMTAFLRAVAIGALSVTFGTRLVALNFSTVQVGVVIAIGLAGMAVGTLVAGLIADRVGRRVSLEFFAVLMAAGGLLLAASESFGLILAATFIGMVNGMGRDRGPSQSIDQAVLAQMATPDNRTALFIRYTYIVDIGTAIGALLSWIPLGAYSGLMAATALLYPFMSRAVETATRATRAVLSPESRRRVFGFAALSTLDSLGGGFVTRSLLTIWLTQRFGQPEHVAGILFFWASLANVLGYFAAGRIAKKIGLVNTMVFTHIPSSVLLMLVPLAPGVGVAAAIWLCREFLSQMDVPTRQSYLAAIVQEHERTAAAGVVNLTRNASWVVGPTLAGWAMTFSLSAPLYFAGGIKILYDLSLWFAFRRIKPPEER